MSDSYYVKVRTILEIRCQKTRILISVSMDGSYLILRCESILSKSCDSIFQLVSGYFVFEKRRDIDNFGRWVVADISCI